MNGQEAGIVATLTHARRRPGLWPQELLRAGLLPGTHKHPFDRMLLAQAHMENLTIIGNHTLLDDYGVQRVW